MGYERFRPGQIRESFRRRRQDAGIRTVSQEVIPHADVNPLFSQLDTFNVGVPITWAPVDAAPIRIGHAMYINPKLTLYIISDGVMVLKTPKRDEDTYRPVSTSWEAHLAFRKNSVFPTEESVREYILHNPYDDRSDTIHDTSDSHDVFREAIQAMYACLEKAKENRERIRIFLDEIAPTDADIAEQAVQAEAVITMQDKIIDDLAKERLPGSKALVLEGNESTVVGYVVPVPREDATQRKLILLRGGDIIVVDIPEGSSMESAYADLDTSVLPVVSQEAFINSLDSTDYSLITSTRSGADSTILEESSAAAREWIQRERTVRRGLLKPRPQTGALLDAVREDVTERPIEDVAHEILGRDFLGVEAIRAAEAYLSDIGKTETFDLQDVPAIPYSVRDLELAKQNGEMLVLRPNRILGRLGVIEDLSLARLVNLFHQSEGIPQPRIFNASEILPDFPNLFSTDDMKLGWALVKKELLNTSQNKTIEDQDSLLYRYGTRLREMGADHNNVRRRTGVEAAWDSLVYFINTGIRLLPDDYDITSTDAHADKPFLIGRFREHGLSLVNRNEGRLAFAAGKDTGVCSTR